MIGEAADSHLITHQAAIADGSIGRSQAAKAITDSRGRVGEHFEQAGADRPFGLGDTSCARMKSSAAERKAVSWAESSFMGLFYPTQAAKRQGPDRKPAANSLDSIEQFQERGSVIHP